MTAIPVDVMKAAKAAHAEFADSRVTDNLTDIIARAIMAERERCARMADQFESDADPDAGGIIAAAIRKGE